jgi:hypothetical protein
MEPLGVAQPLLRPERRRQVEREDEARDAPLAQAGKVDVAAPLALVKVAGVLPEAGGDVGVTALRGLSRASSP